VKILRAYISEGSVSEFLEVVFLAGRTSRLEAPVAYALRPPECVINSGSGSNGARDFVMLRDSILNVYCLRFFGDVVAASVYVVKYDQLLGL
jgi:hypothetical protein